MHFLASKHRWNYGLMIYAYLVLRNPVPRKAIASFMLLSTGLNYSCKEQCRFSKPEPRFSNGKIFPIFVRNIISYIVVRLMINGSSIWSTFSHCLGVKRLHFLSKPGRWEPNLRSPFQSVLVIFGANSVFSTLFFNWTLWSFILYFSLNEATMDFCSLAEFGFSFLLIIFAFVYSYTK